MAALTLTGNVERGAVEAATTLVVELVSRDEVAAAWGDESSCAGMSVGALAWHLVNQPQRVVELLGGPTTSGAQVATPVTLDEHYARSAWVRDDLDAPSNRGIRERGEQQAEAGPAAAVAAARAALDALDGVLGAAPPSVVLPWTRWALSTDDFLVTRLMEMVVHSDDLAVSVDVPAPQFPPGVLDPVLALLTGLALRRHGQDGLVRALARPQRGPATIAAF